MLAAFILFIVLPLLAWFLAWKRLLTPIAILIFIAGVVFWKVTGYIDGFMISSEFGLVGIAYTIFEFGEWEKDWR